MYNTLPNTSAKLLEMDTASTTHSTPKKVQILLKSWSLKINFCCQIICTCESSSGKNVKMYIEQSRPSQVDNLLKAQ